MRIRRSIQFSGCVQGVGFRYTTQRISASFDVVGYVKNLSDGRVELVAEGRSDEIDRFVEAIHAQMGQLIRDAQCAESPATDQYHGFTIAF